RPALRSRATTCSSYANGSPSASAIAFRLVGCSGVWRPSSTIGRTPYSALEEKIIGPYPTREVGDLFDGVGWASRPADLFLVRRGQVVSAYGGVAARHLSGCEGGGAGRAPPRAVGDRRR